MKVSGRGSDGRAVARLALALALALALPATPGLILAASAQDVGLVAGATAVERVADAERAFDRLDASAGIRSGGPFSFDYQHLAFFPDVDPDRPMQPVDLWTAVSVQADRIRPVFEGGWKYSVSMTVELWQDDTLAFSREALTSLTVAAPLSRDATAESGFPVQARLQVPPGEYEYRIRVADDSWEGDRGTNETSGRLVVPDPVLTQPFVSSIAVAADSGGSWKPAPDLALKLNAAKIVYGDARPFVYFEAYGLTPGGDYRGEVRLVSRRVTRGADDVFDGAYQPFQLQYRGSVSPDPGEPVRKVLRLDLGRTRPGPYEVQVRVRDLVTGQASEVRTARLRVQEARAFEPLQPVVGTGTEE
ncbi:MAG: hypothetical protein ACODAB_06405 [Gemmatimonadota bacterium]